MRSTAADNTLLIVVKTPPLLAGLIGNGEYLGLGSVQQVLGAASIRIISRCQQSRWPRRSVAEALNAHGRFLRIP